MKRLAIAVAVSLLLGTAANAAPSAPIAAAMAAPASVFDVFLYRLYESAKCRNWLGKQDVQPDPCMTSLSFDADANLLTVHFEMYPTNSALGDFIEANDDVREQIMLAQMERLARLSGVVDTWGLLHSIPMRHGWGGSNLDEDAVRKALAARTALHLHVTYGSKVFTVTRDEDGFTDVELTVRRTN